MDNKYLVLKKKRNKERILDNTWKKVEQRKEKIKKKVLSTKSLRQRDQLQAECRATDKEERKSSRADRKAYTKNLMKQNKPLLCRICKPSIKFQNTSR